MGWLALAALIPAFRGEVGTSLCMLAADLLLDSQERKDRAQYVAQEPRIVSVTKKDIPDFMDWLKGKGWSKYYNPDNSKTIIDHWNHRFGNKCYLSPMWDFIENLKAMVSYWASLGKPIYATRW